MTPLAAVMVERHLVWGSLRNDVKLAATVVNLRKRVHRENYQKLCSLFFWWPTALYIMYCRQFC
jgi:hypothetical protein